MMFGYVAEYKLRKTWFQDPRFKSVRKYDDHDRTRKGDLSIIYRDAEIRVEAKALQTHTVKRDGAGWKGAFQCDASDRRTIALPDGQEVTTTCLKVGDFDLLAVCLFAFGGTWRFAFAKNKDLPRSDFKKYPPGVRNQLIKTMIPVTWPLQPPFRDEPFELLDEIVLEMPRGGAGHRS